MDENFSLVSRISQTSRCSQIQNKGLENEQEISGCPNQKWMDEAKKTDGLGWLDLEVKGKGISRRKDLKWIDRSKSEFGTG